jgi:hypothetical protein
MPQKMLIERGRAEFLEMPDLRLTIEQAERLWGVRRTVCQAVLDALVDAKFLRRKPNGVYARLTEGSLSPQRHCL